MSPPSRHAGVRNDLPTAAAIGALAYLTADVAHHAFGHAAACLALGGEVRSLSSVFVACSVTGADVDLAGPGTNLLLGALAALLALVCARRARPLGFFLLLAAAFNLYWLTLQLVFSVATDSDDWAWPLRVAHAGSAVRWLLALAAAASYHLVSRFVGRRLGIPERSEARRVVLCTWLAAGAVACLTAAFAPAPLATLAQALPQSLGLSIGLLFTPAVSARRAPSAGGVIPRSWPWIALAVVGALVSGWLLGPGVPLRLPA